MKGNKLLSAMLAATGLVSISNVVYAGPGVLEDVPLSISTTVQPNILFVLDDSGSMTSQLLKVPEAGVVGAHPSTSLSGTVLAADLSACTSGAFNFNFSTTYNTFPSEGFTDFSPDDEFIVVLTDSVNFFNCTFTPNSTTYNPGQAEMLQLCRGYNATGFDPVVAAQGGYTPWIGNNSDGAVYDDVTLATALNNPYDTSTGANVSSHIYFPWNDAIAVGGDGDGVYDVGECATNFSEIDTNSNGIISNAECDAAPDSQCLTAQNTPNPTVEIEGVTRTINFQEQYANWYTYYRTREHIAKRAMSEIISDSSERMGMATLHNNSAVGTLIEDMRDGGNKSSLLTNLFRVRSTGGTPLRRSLHRAGQYFEQGVDVDANYSSEILTPSYTVANNGFFGFTPNHHSDPIPANRQTVSADSPFLDTGFDGACQQNFTVLFSDGFWNGANPLGGIGNADNSSGGPGEVAGLDGGSFMDNFSVTLADIAMHYYERDLSRGSNGLANNLNVEDPHGPLVGTPAEPNRINHQHMTTYTVAFGVNGQLTSNPQRSDTSFGWTQPVSNTRSTIDDMRHAAWNGRGQFLNAGNPQDLISSFQDAVRDIENRTGTASAASLSSGLIETDTLFFRTTFDTSDWAGDLEAFGFSASGVDTAPTWSATASLRSQIETAVTAGAVNFGRNVMTYNRSTAQGVSFEFPNLNANQSDDLLINMPATSTASEYGPRIVNYLKGDSTYEEGIFTDADGGGVDDDPDLFRARNGQYLNAFVNSSPQYMGPPNDKYPNFIESSTAPYNDYKENESLEDRSVVFVGGNNGMLHAFDAQNSAAGGSEIFAYIPSFLENDLSSIAEPDYSHIAYVDATPTVRDVYVRNAWRTYLVGGTRSGGQGIFALDVTNPTLSSNPADIVQFEFTDPDLGYTYSRPQIAKMNDADGSWVAIFGNGYNADGETDGDGNFVPHDGRGKLFIVDLEDGSLIAKIDTGIGNNNGGSCLDTAGTAVDGDPASDCNGLSSPALVDLNGDFKVDRIYAGDLKGNMWVFDVSSSSPSDWESSTSRTALFTACEDRMGCTEDNRQAITVQPEVTLHPSRRSSTTSPNVLVYFGTGQFIASGDADATSVQSFYAVWDYNVGGLTKSNLQRRSFELDSTDNTIDVVPGDDAEDVIVDYLVTGERGWYIDLSIENSDLFDGARSVINPVLSGRLVLFLLTVPSGDPCARNSTGYRVVLDSLNGTRPSFSVFDSSGNDGVPDDSSPVSSFGENTEGVGLTISGNDEVITLSDGEIAVTDITDGVQVPAGRKSWSILR